MILTQIKSNEDNIDPSLGQKMINNIVTGYKLLVFVLFICYFGTFLF